MKQTPPSANYHITKCNLKATVKYLIDNTHYVGFVHTTDGPVEVVWLSDGSTAQGYYDGYSLIKKVSSIQKPPREYWLMEETKCEMCGCDYYLTNKQPKKGKNWIHLTEKKKS